MIDAEKILELLKEKENADGILVEIGRRSQFGNKEFFLPSDLADDIENYILEKGERLTESFREDIAEVLMVRKINPNFLKSFIERRRVWLRSRLPEKIESILFRLRQN